MRTFVKLLALVMAGGLLLGFCCAGCSSSDSTSSDDGGGGGGGGVAVTTISGVAASGAAISGVVYLKDSLGTIVGPNAIATDGSFTFTASQLSGLTPPYFLEAKGSVGTESVTLYSSTTSAGTANINPLTNLAVAMASGTDPATVYENSTNYADLALDAAIAQIQATLADLLVLYNAAEQNPLTGAYTADSTGLDALFDVVKIEVVNAAVTITDPTGETLLNSAVGDMADAVLGDVSSLTGTEDDMTGIAGLLQNLATLLNTDGLEAEDLADLFMDEDNFGILDGYGLADTLAYLASAPGSEWEAGEIEKVSFTVLKKDEETGVYWIKISLLLTDGTTEGPRLPWCVVQDEDGAWKITGNNFKLSDLTITPRARKEIHYDGSVAYVSGMELEADDDANLGVDYVIVKGPGLPENGVKLVRPDAASSYLTWEGDGSNGDVLYPLSDASITEIAETITANGKAVYTATAYDADDTFLEAHKVKVFAPPLPSETTDAQGVLETYFVTVTPPDSSHCLCELDDLYTGGGTFTFSYTLPTQEDVGLNRLRAWLNFSNTEGNYAEFKKKRMTLADGSASMIISSLAWTPDHAYLGVIITDSYYREFEVNWGYQQE